MSKVNKFSYNPQLWKEANIGIIANRVESALLDTDAVPQIRQCIAKSVPQDCIIDTKVRNLLLEMLHRICERIDKLPVITQDAGGKE